MQKKFVYNLALIIVLNLIVKPFFILGIDAEIQNRVGASEYGLYFSLLNLTFIFNIILDFGLVNYNTKNIAEYPNLISSYFNKLFSIRLVLFLLYIVSILIFSLILGYNKIELYYISILVFNQFLIACIQFFRSNLTGLHLFKTDAILSILDRSLLIIICIVLLWSGWFDTKFKIEWFIYAQTVAYGTTAIIGFFMIKRKIGAFKIEFNYAKSLSLIKKSMPYALLIFLMFIYNRIDSIMLERMLNDGKVHAGIYAQGFRYLDAINMFALMFAGILLPIYARILKEKKDIYQMVETPLRLLIPFSILIGITCYFNSELIMNFRYTAYISSSSISFGVLILSFIPISITYIFGTLLTANGSLRQLNWMAVLGVIINLLLNIILIPKLLSYGAAIATLITQSITAIIQILIAYRIFKFKLNFKLLSQILLYILIITFLNSSLTVDTFAYFTNNPNLIFSLKLLIGGLFILITGIIKITHLKALFKSKNQTKVI